MKTRGMNSFFRLLLVLSVLLILSGCLTLYCCRERYVTVAKDGKGATIGYRFKNFGTNDINGYTIYVAVTCKDIGTGSETVIYDRQSFDIIVKAGDDYKGMYLFSLNEEQKGYLTVKDAKITETSLTIYR